MTVQSLKEGLSLFGFEVDITKEWITFEHKNAVIEINRSISEDELKVLLMNVPNWFTIAKEATGKEGR